jgi:hypothetical protein
MTLVRGEVPKGHPVIATDFRIQLMHCAREAVRREPLGQCVWLEERAIDLIRLGGQNAVQMNSVGHDHFSFSLQSLKTFVTSVIAAPPPNIAASGHVSGRRPLAIDHPWGAEFVD